MKKRFVSFFLCFVLIAALLPISASADMGPKPSVRIEFENMGTDLCYGTLLSKARSTGPASAWDGKSGYYHWGYGEEGEPIWQAFIDYEDPDGYYFLQEWWECSENGQLNWTYYPPQSFKILLYYPATDTYAVSDIYERYAFDSYFTADLSEVDVLNPSAVQHISVEKSYDHSAEIISLICRIIITILVELGIALLFKLRGKNLIKLVALTNIATQVILNVLLYAANYSRGQFFFVFIYVILEIFVFVIEAVIYTLCFKKVGGEEVSRRRAVAYAFAANLVSFIAGLAIAKLIPGIF
ncbi:MAG: hypothetical protein IKV47_03075 [Oscillospiraceae bacterium]|nr:hypothetical protein [Oscillospiraceae bacterium]